ncbi:hypothetical protein PHYBLDRAFT_166265 [Phycomyces blakesleeanus NRRL 1555(-)]|uniref:Uncharacterized protein n=1 Tax=Phycomyces blakesleeanus (strain ATCC 8743b / DSM 1359 / FGSC 10004 / NBRC 33097 / NRRL 1555) TaxID=763407 RepID=A0A162UM75_PHYB8|nr:hypothetical protein PHYBLDRAFT_166265 [Phycomyces blakesleeanus NRRL 1555(-)]OAD76293.1 hypothetical protein PHYBLDRAFT_166265 [Phycomyces blakesleeanus NRRL 1555(-)]|eukprot:XP_018294333.1 hypothetical protein PHYBLDRAFT_166265 [Phycomyces blakesleeanus NRRL 1555(-)]
MNMGMNGIGLANDVMLNNGFNNLAQSGSPISQSLDATMSPSMTSTSMSANAMNPADLITNGIINPAMMLNNAPGLNMMGMYGGNNPGNEDAGNLQNVMMMMQRLQQQQQQQQQQQKEFEEAFTSRS